MTHFSGFRKIIFIAQPVRKRENLLVLLRSATGLPDIFFVDSFPEAEELILPGCRTLAVIDHNISLAETRVGIETIRRKDPTVHCVLMLSHPLQQSHFVGVPCDGWVYDDFSLDDLRILLANLILATPYSQPE
jgi:hypothetical protein